MSRESRFFLACIAPLKPSHVSPVVENRVDVEHRPDTVAVLRMLGDLWALYRVKRALACSLGVSVWSLSQWMSGSRHPTQPALRAIWFLHCLHFAPWKLATTFDLITWGKYAVRPDDWEGPEPPQPIVD